jgi:hypothetical protein
LWLHINEIIHPALLIGGSQKLACMGIIGFFIPHTGPSPLFSTELAMNQHLADQTGPSFRFTMNSGQFSRLPMQSKSVSPSHQFELANLTLAQSVDVDIS